MKFRSISRREFAAVLGGTAALALGFPRTTEATLFCPNGPMGKRGPHPDPRPGVDGSKVLTADQLNLAPHMIEVYDGIRKIPEIADGIRCMCGCAELPGFRSLLICYEENGMARFCDICEGQGRLTIRLHGRGRTLDQIRAAIDARYG